MHVPTRTAELYPGDIKSVLLSEDQIKAKTAELAAQIAGDYQDAESGQDLLLVTVLKGAVMFVTDLARAIPVPTQLEFMAVSSYGSSTSSSGVVRILKDRRPPATRASRRGGATAICTDGPTTFTL